MKIKQLLIKTLFVAVGLCAGASVAWADYTTVGKTDNTTGYWTDGFNSEAYKIEPNHTKTFQFVNYSSKVNAFNGWYTLLSSNNNVWSYNDHYIRLRPDFYGWTESNGNTNQSPAWLVGNLNNSGCNWNDPESVTAFKNNIDEATVNLTIKRLGNEVYIISDVTGTSYNYRHYFVMTCGDGRQDIYAFLCVDGSHIVIDDSKTVDTETETISGTLLGVEENTGDFGNGRCEDFTIAPDGTLNLRFKNYTNKINKWNNWAFELQQDDQYADVVTGGGNWGTLITGITVDADKITWDGSTWPAGDDAAFMTALDGADVNLTITRAGAKITATAVHTPISGDPFTIKYSFTPAKEGFADANVTFRLLTEGGHLDLLPVTKTITSAGWATYCSPYALDLEHATGLTEAYIVTGGNDGVLTLTSVKNGTVPANTGLLLKGSEGTVTIPIVGSSTTNVAANKLKGVTENKEIAAGTGYVLMGSPSVGFYQNSNAFTVGANTAYLPANFAATTARGFYSFGDATGIKAIDNSSTSEAAKPSAQFAIDNYYNVAGQRVAAPTKGLYIKNGKKIVVK
jgi:hypothetical protein